MTREKDGQNDREKRDLAAWRRLVAACDLERKYMHERSATFLTVQGFLMAAFGVTLSSHVLIDPLFLLFVHLAICCIGCLTSLSALASIGASAWMHHAWSRQLRTLVDNSPCINQEHYFTHGCCAPWPVAVVRLAPAIGPAVLTLSWLGLFFVSIFYRLT